MWFVYCTNFQKQRMKQFKPNIFVSAEISQTVWSLYCALKVGIVEPNGMSHVMLYQKNWPNWTVCRLWSEWYILSNFQLPDYSQMFTHGISICHLKKSLKIFSGRIWQNWLLRLFPSFLRSFVFPSCLSMISTYLWCKLQKAQEKMAEKQAFCLRASGKDFNCRLFAVAYNFFATTGIFNCALHVFWTHMQVTRGACGCRLLFLLLQVYVLKVSYLRRLKKGCMQFACELQVVCLPRAYINLRRACNLCNLSSKGQIFFLKSHVKLLPLRVKTCFNFDTNISTTFIRSCRQNYLLFSK